MFLRYIKYTVWQPVLCTILSFLLCQMCFLGFYVDEAQMAAYGRQIALTLVIMAVLWLFHYGRRSRIAGVILVAAVLIVTIVVLAATGQLLTVIQDSLENPWLYYVIIAISSLAVWLLGLSVYGTILLFGAGILISALIQFLYEDNRFVWLALFLIVCMVHLALQYYLKNMMEVQTMKSSFRGLALVSVVGMIVVLLAASGIYYGIVRPISPPTRELKIIDREDSYQMIDIFGLVNFATLPEYDKWADQQRDEQTTGSESESDAQSQENAQEQQTQQAQGDQLGDVDTTLDLSAEEADLSAVHYHLTERIKLLLWIIAAAVAAAFLLKTVHRRFRRKRLLAGSPQEQINGIYQEWIRIFAVLKTGKNPDETPREYIQRCKARLLRFMTPQMDMEQLTELFIRCVYGNQSPETEEAKQAWEYYDQRCALVRRYVGWRYVWMYWIL